MTITVPEGARAAARVVLINDSNEVLFLEGREQGGKSSFWVLPGGGLEPGETFAEAAIREAYEETGFEVDLDACLWTRHHLFRWQNQVMNQFEVFFAASVCQVDVQPRHQDSYIHSHRWWSLDALQHSNEIFAPRQIADLLADVLAGRFPDQPFDCGV